MGRDEGFEFPSRQWRSMLREQQLADNRKLLDSVRSVTNRNYHNYKNIPDKKANNWLPVHELALNQHRSTNLDNNRRLRLNQIDTNNNQVITSSHKRREISEPPIQKSETSKSPPPKQIKTSMKISTVREKFDKLDRSKAPILSLKDRKNLGDTFTSYLNILPPDLRETPGFEKLLSNTPWAT